MLIVVNNNFGQLQLNYKHVFRNFNTLNSDLGSNCIYRVIADHNGYVWLATDNGLIRYDGRSFKTMGKAPYDEYVHCHEDKRHFLWLFTSIGTSIGLDLNSQTLINTDKIYGINRLKQSSKSYLSALENDSELLLSPIYIPELVSIKISKKESHIEHMSSSDYFNKMMQKFGLKDNEINNIRKEIAFGYITKNYGPHFYARLEKDFLFVFNRIYAHDKTGKTYLYFDGSKYGIHDPISGCCLTNRNLHISFFKSNSGLLRFSNYDNSKARYKNIDTLLVNDGITNIANDNSNNLWVCTINNGLFQFEERYQNCHYYNKEISGLKSSNIVNIKFFKNDYQWINYNEGGQFSFYFNKKIINPKIETPIKIKYIYLIDTNKYLCITENKFYYLKKGSLSNKFTIIENDSLFDDYSFRDVNYLDTKTIICNNNVVYFIDNLNKRTFHINSGLTNQKSIQYIDSTNLFIGTASGAYHNHTLLPYLTNQTINKVRLINHDLVWCTNTGIFCINSNSAFDVKQLRCIKNIKCLDVKWDDSNLYFRTDEGILICRISDYSTLDYISFRKFPLPSIINNFDLNKDYISIATNNGLFGFPKKDFTSKKALIPQIHIVNSLNNNRPCDSFFKCKYNRNLTTSFDIDILDYSNASKSIYYEVIKDGEIYINRTTTDKNNTLIKILKPKPGTYTIRYTVKDENKNWSCIKSYSFIVLPIWWQTTWFNALLIICFLALLLLFIWRIQVYYKRKAEKQLKVEMHLFELESQNILAQLKPHFIFNILTPLQNYFLND